MSQLTVLSNPREINIKKNMMDQKTDPPRVAMTSGYTMNTRLGPARATSMRHCEKYVQYMVTDCTISSYRPEMTKIQRS